MTQPGDWDDDAFRRWLARGLAEHYADGRGSLRGFEPYEYLLDASARFGLADALVRFYGELPRRAQERFRTALMRVGLEAPANPAREAEPLMHLIVELGRRLPAPEVCRVIEARLMSFGGLSTSRRLVRAALPTLLAHCKADGVDALLIRFLDLDASQPADVTVVFRALVATRPTQLTELVGTWAPRIQQQSQLRQGFLWRDVRRIVGQPAFDACLRRLHDEQPEVMTHIHVALSYCADHFIDPATDPVDQAAVSRRLRGAARVAASVKEERDEQTSD